ncbi:MAG: DNA polymerase III subunit gamma/tau, partial [Mycobacterium sp.]
PAAPVPAAPVPARPQPQPQPEPEPVSPAPEPARPEPEPAVATPGEPDATAVRAMWPAVRDKVRQRSRTTEVMLAGATVRAVEGDTLVLTHESAPLAKRLSEQRNADVITDALKDALGVNWRVRCESGGPPVAAAAPTTPVADRARRADEEAMLAEAAKDATEPSAPRRDPEEAALELLQNELGARRIDGD